MCVCLSISPSISLESQLFLVSALGSVKFPTSSASLRGSGSLWAMPWSPGSDFLSFSSLFSFLSKAPRAHRYEAMVAKAQSGHQSEIFSSPNYLASSLKRSSASRTKSPIACNSAHTTGLSINCFSERLFLNNLICLEVFAGGRSFFQGGSDVESLHFVALKWSSRVELPHIFSRNGALASNMLCEIGLLM